MRIVTIWRQKCAFQSTLPTRGSDRVSFASQPLTGLFQSTLPTRGSDGLPCMMSRRRCIFQSTLPTRGSDNNNRARGKPVRYFNPRSPRGGATWIFMPPKAGRWDFNPRSPRGGATSQGIEWISAMSISIHAPHEGERHSGAFFSNAF